MAYAEQITPMPADHVGDWSNTREVRPEHQFFKSELSDSATTSDHEFRFSESVRRLFRYGVITLIASGTVSLVGVVAENDAISMVGAFLLVLAGVFLASWLTRANVERKTQLGR